jgi:Outer membrane protein beta-barrel domain
MRKLIAAVIIGAGTLLAAPAFSADLPPYTPPPSIPPVDYGLGGSFYLRGSVGGNAYWAHDADYGCGCTTTATNWGYGYSFGVGIGYETGTGVRFDGTLDYLSNSGLSDGTYKLDLKTTLGLVNVYYDFPLGDAGSGGLDGYVGAGAGIAYNQTHTTGGLPDGSNTTVAGALMAGVSYDMGNVVTDLGYRLVYMPTVSNGASGANNYTINNNFIHEIRGTVRYRFN